MCLLNTSILIPRCSCILVFSVRMTFQNLCMHILGLYLGYLAFTLFYTLYVRILQREFILLSTRKTSGGGVLCGSVISVSRTPCLGRYSPTFL